MGMAFLVRRSSSAASVTRVINSLVLVLVLAASLWGDEPECVEVVAVVEGYTKAAPIGDVDGDALDDHVIAYGDILRDDQRVGILRSSDWSVAPVGASVLRDMRSGSVCLLEGAGDITGDGVGEVLVSSFGDPMYLQVVDYYGPDGVLLEVDLASRGWQELRGVAAGVDLNGDSTPDVLAACSRQSDTRFYFGIVAISGSGGSILYEQTVRSGAPTPARGQVMFAGDFDHDGVRDAFVALPSVREGESEVVLVSGHSGERVGQLMRPESVGEVFGVQMYTLGDVNGDGVSDIAVVAAPDYRSTEFDVCVYSGADEVSLLAAQKVRSKSVWCEGGLVNGWSSEGVGRYSLLVATGDYGYALRDFELGVPGEELGGCNLRSRYRSTGTWLRPVDGAGGRMFMCLGVTNFAEADVGVVVMRRLAGR